MATDMNRYRADAQYRDRAKEYARLFYWTHPEYRERHKAQQRARRKADPEYRARVNAYARTYQKRWRAMKRKDPKYMAQKRERQRERYADPEYRARLRTRARARYARDKAEAVRHLTGGAVRCAVRGCSVVKLDMIEFDHIRNDRIERGDPHGFQLFWMILEMNSREARKIFQPLCASHHREKTARDLKSFPRRGVA